MAITTIPSSGTTDGTNLVILNHTTVDGTTATVDFDNTLVTSTYDNYYVIGANVLPATDNVTARFQLSSDNGSNFKNVDTGRQYNRLDAAASGHEFSNSANHLQLATSLGNDSNRGGSFIIYLNNLNILIHYFPLRLPRE